jgi:ElaB/YqjD/DUF883 family membrane-anchored ribosome-binding protein
MQRDFETPKVAKLPAAPHDTAIKPEKLEDQTMETHFPQMETESTREARERLMEDVKTLARDAEELLKATANDMSDKAKEARSKLAAAVERAKASCENLGVNGLEQAKVAAKRTDEAIRTHPYESLGVAFVVGLLFGAVLRRK